MGNLKFDGRAGGNHNLIILSFEANSKNEGRTSNARSTSFNAALFIARSVSLFKIKLRAS
jgi:hypothetical protein